MKKKIFSGLLVLSMLLSLFSYGFSESKVQAASVKYIEGQIDAYAPQRMYMKVTNKYITVSGYYGIGKSRNKAFNTTRKRAKKTFKVAATCKVQEGDDVLETMGYDYYLENRGKKFAGPCVGLKIKNGKVVKVICHS